MSWFNGRSNGKYATAVSTRNPLARTEDLVIEDLDDEVLLYDKRNARAHCLSGPAAQVWRASDGQTRIEDLVTDLGLDADTVHQAIGELESNGLLDGPILSNGTTRRQFSISAVKAGAAIGAAPMIYSVLAPTPAAAATPSFAQCNFYSAASCDGCTNICGCCCCCEGCSSATGVPSCKICQPTHACGVAYQGANCLNAPGVGGTGCNTPHCSASAADGPQCTNITASNYPPPGGNNACCFPACVNGQPTLEAIGVGCGNGSQPCNCTGEDNPCG